MLITQVNQSHRSIAIPLQPGVLPSISWRFSHDEKISLDLHRYVISLTFKIFCVAISEPKMCFSFIISDPDYEKVCYSWAFIGKGLSLSGNRALDGSLIHVKDPSTIWVDNVTNHTFTTKLYPQRSDCNIQIDLLSNQPIYLFFFFSLFRITLIREW